jgi:hypothetical protein
MAIRRDYELRALTTAPRPPTAAQQPQRRATLIISVWPRFVAVAVKDHDQVNVNVYVGPSGG